jgi:hypothetical protein
MEKIRYNFRLETIAIVGDRGMFNSKNIEIIKAGKSIA